MSGKNIPFPVLTCIETQETSVGSVVIQFEADIATLTWKMIDVLRRSLPSFQATPLADQSAIQGIRRLHHDDAEALSARIVLQSAKTNALHIDRQTSDPSLDSDPSLR